tara:strand:+ start:34568 stop:34705 length:138 start_codon:yes stop_codon:yes gene_type:complete
MSSQEEPKAKPNDRWYGEAPAQCTGKCAIGGPVFYSCLTCGWQED